MNNTIIIYLLISFTILFLSAKISYKFKLLDKPNKRKIHTNSTAYSGGIAISIALILSILLFNIPNNTLNLILSIGFLVSLVGFIDDTYNLNVGGKLSLQVFPIIYLVIIQNLNLNHIGDYGYFKIELGAFAIPFTLLCVLFLINSFNYFDGMDGVLSFSSISVLLILFFLFPNENFNFFLILITIPLIIFLCFNFSLFNLPKMFLGDSGSLLLGFIISFILIYLSKKSLIHPILLAWSVVIFVYEFLSVNIIRLRMKRNLFSAGQDHLHNIFFTKYKSIFLTNLFIFSLNIILFLIGYFSYMLINPFASLILFISIFMIFLYFRNRFS